MNPLSKIFALFKIKVDDKPLKKGKKSTEAFSSALKKMAIVAGAAVVGKALFGMSKGLIDTGDELDKASKRVGTTTDTIQEFRFAADISGVSAEKLSMAMGLIQQKAFDAANGSAEAAKVFDKLGASLNDSNGELKSIDELVLSAADGIAGLANQTEKTALSMKIFGESGKDLVPFLELGREGIEKLRAEQRALGGGMTRDVIEKAAQTQDELTRMKVAYAGITSQVAGVLLPAMSKLIGWMTKGVAWFRRMTEGVDLGNLAIAALAVGAIPALALALSFLLSPTALIAAGFAALVLVVESLITAYQGGKSVVRDFLLEHFNYDIRGFLDGIVEGWFFLKEAMNSNVPIIDQIGLAFSVMFAKVVQSAAEAALSIIKSLSPVLQVLGAVPGFGQVAVAATAGIADAARRVKSGTQQTIDSDGALFRKFAKAGDKAAFDATAGVRANRQQQDALRVDQTLGPLFATAGLPSRQQAATNVANNNVNISVNGAADPAAVAKEVNRVIQFENRKAMSAVDS